MIEDFHIIHRRKPRLFANLEAPVWSTCLRSLAFASPGLACDPDDEIFSHQSAYRFLLEVVCGLKSPIVGETEVFGQFKEFSQEWIKIEPRRSPLVQRVLNDAKAIRSEHLTNLGTQSYGSWVRKNLRATRVHILGAGLLVREILPYLQKLDMEIVLHVRDAAKVDFYSGPVCSINARGFDRGAIVVAAPLASQQFAKWLGEGVIQTDQVFDLRDNSDSEPLSLQAGMEIYRLSDIFSEIAQTKALLLPRLEQIHSEIQTRSEKAADHSQLRPQGWDDICA